MRQPKPELLKLRLSKVSLSLLPPSAAAAWIKIKGMFISLYGRNEE